MASKRTVRSAGLVTVALLTAVVLAACAKSSTTPSSGGTTSGGNGGGTASVKVSTASIAGMGKVLVDTNGMTLYTLSTEAGGTIKCTGTCAANWPPLLVTGGMSAMAGSGMNMGDLGTIKRPDGGTQVTYKGLPLYLYVGDQSAGQDTGEGVAGFSTATPSGGAPSSPSSSGSGHYGY